MGNRTIYPLHRFDGSIHLKKASHQQFVDLDCVMLSGESASGEYPVESVLMQTKIARTMEKHLNLSGKH